MVGSLLMDRVGKARALLARGQYAELLDQVSSRWMPAGNPVLYWDRFVIVELAEARPLRRRPDQTPVLASPEDLEAIVRERPDRRDLIARRLAEGQRCYVIRDHGRVVARQWVVGDRPVFPTNSGYAFTPPIRPALWCHDIFVDPAHRMRGLFVSLMLNVLTVDPGPRPRLYGEIHFLNQGSIRAHLSLGYRIVRTVTVVSTLGLKVYRIEDEGGKTTFATRHAWRVRHI